MAEETVKVAGFSVGSLVDVVIGLIVFVLMVRFASYIPSFLTGTMGAVIMGILGAVALVYARKAGRVEMLVKGVGIGLLFYATYSFAVPKITAS